MTLAEKLKQRLIFDIERIFSKCQIYYNPNTRSVWFINPETKFWYFEYSLDGDLWWRYTGFNIFKDLYRMDDKTFNNIISEWVEETLNCKVFSVESESLNFPAWVEETLNCKVLSTHPDYLAMRDTVEETLNCKVLSTDIGFAIGSELVEEALKCKVLTTESYNVPENIKVEEALKCKVLTTIKSFTPSNPTVEETLKCKVITIEPYEPFNEVNTDKIINESQTI
jgi:hypothetical protein